MKNKCNKCKKHADALYKADRLHEIRYMKWLQRNANLRQKFEEHRKVCLEKAEPYLSEQEHWEMLDKKISVLGMDIDLDAKSRNKDSSQ